MILEKINSPKDLKLLSLEELEKLAEEVRSYIIEVVSKKGGHLASNLGVVELTIALHRCLNLPEDKLLWDVGHQCYVHKILTSRRQSFKNLRTKDGLSGFPSPQESEYDVFITGHASTVISLGLGLCCARDIKREKFHVVCVVGDGSLSGGMSFEALNNCGHLKKDILVVLNSNEMSISKTVGAISTYINKIITNPLYNKFRKELEEFIKHLPRPAKKFTQVLRKFEEGVKNILVPGILFEELGFRYFGPLDGHNLKLLISTIENILKLRGPRLLHVVTKKGKGYEPAERHPEIFHSSLPFDISTGKHIKKSGPSFTDVFSKKLVEIAKRDSRIVGITAAMKEGTGLKLFEENFPERFFDTGIAESHAVAFASGLSKLGLKPVVAIYSTFLQRAFDQLIHDVALQGTSPVFVLDRSGLVGEDGPTHHGIFDIAYLRMMPNFVIMAPKDKRELEDMLEFAVNLEQPCAIRFPKARCPSTGLDEPLKLGSPQVIKKGKEIALVGVGIMTVYVLDILPLLERESITPTLINARFIKPLDREFYTRLIKSHNLIFILEEGIESGGFGASILELCEEEDLDQAKIKIIALPDEFITFAKREELLQMYGLKGESLFKRIFSSVKETHLV